MNVKDVKGVKSPPISSSERRCLYKSQKSYKKSNLSIDLKNTQKSLSENELYDKVIQNNITSEFLCNLSRKSTSDKTEKISEKFNFKNSNEKKIVGTNQSIILEKKLIYKIKDNYIYKSKDLIFDEEETKEKCGVNCLGSEGLCLIF